MRIARFESQLLRIPMARPITPPEGGDRGRLDHVFMLAVHLSTDAGLRGLGFAYALEGGGRALKAVADDDLAPLVVNEDAADHERLAAKACWRLQAVGRRGLVAQAYSAVDLALWDLKGKAAGLPLYKLLGGARESAPCYGADTAWRWMDARQILDASQPYLEQGMVGIKVKIGNDDPEVDARRLAELREVWGEDVWLGVDANQRYDYGAALSMGRHLEEEIAPAWFEEPVLCEDIDSHVRLADKLDLPLALGESLFGIDEVRRYLERDAVAVLQPDVTRLGGLTAWLKVAALAEAYHVPLAPHVLPEVGVHLACGLTNVTLVEYMPWLFPAFVEPPRLENGKLVPPPRPGLGLELDPQAVEHFRAG